MLPFFRAKFLRASPSWWSVRPADVLSITASGIYVNTARDNLSPQMVICMFFIWIYFLQGCVDWEGDREI
ncbi:TPA: hypothetical protein HIA40_14655 [Escherichia coli]|nr:hypothetical protein [Escherichia coli]